MSRTLVRRIVVAGFLLNLVAVIWPVLGLFRSPEPFVFGLPLSMAWPVAWIVVGWVLLLCLDYSEERGGD
jgi:hypothetical protein